MKVSWIVSPLSLAFAQKFLPEHTWVPFFNVVAFVIGTYINAHTKKKRLAALRKKVCERYVGTRTSTNNCHLRSMKMIGALLVAEEMTIPGGADTERDFQIQF